MTSGPTRSGTLTVRRWTRDGIWARILFASRAGMDASGPITWRIEVDPTGCAPTAPSRVPVHGSLDGAAHAGASQSRMASASTSTRTSGSKR